MVIGMLKLSKDNPYLDAIDLNAFVYRVFHWLVIKSCLEKELFLCCAKIDLKRIIETYFGKKIWKNGFNLLALNPSRTAPVMRPYS